MNTQSTIGVRRSHNLQLIEQETIAFPTSIQPYGALLVLQEEGLTIIQVSGNVRSILGYSTEQLLNRPLTHWVKFSIIKSIEQHLRENQLQRINPLQLQINSMAFTGFIHQHQSYLILELEPTPNEKNSAEPNFYHLTKWSALQLHQAENLTELCERAVQDIRKITGYDRVMLYKFHEGDRGSVIAEAKREDLNSYLGLHYPDTDIPKPARDLFLQHSLRFINDVGAKTVSITPKVNPKSGESIDLRHSILRSASPCHLQYLSNMGVRSSMAISLVQNERLWGLIACHNYSQKFIPHQQRAACEFLGHALSIELAHKQYNEDYEYQLYLKDVQSSLLELMSQSEDYAEGLIANPKLLLSLVNARGAAIILGDRYSLIGETPRFSYLEKLLGCLEPYLEESHVFATSCLSEIEPSAEAYKDVASGILAISISGSQPRYLIWFRPEVLHTLNWAGNPEDSFQTGEDDRIILCPRKSFALWKETVNMQCLPWKNCEIEAALSLRQSIVKVVLKNADQLARANAALSKSEAKERERAIQLEQALQELKQAQTQLIQSEKMSGLGQLVAGIAHEINNPVNFIYGNLAHVESYLGDLLSILELYKKYYPEPNEEVQEGCEAVDIDFLLEDFPKVIESMQLGADRIHGIVQSLRNFSRLDESDMKAVNLDEGIESTLLILNNRIKAKSNRPAIALMKQYSELPEIECYPSQLNQVFMNLLTNAIDALEEGNSQRQISYKELEEQPNRIIISTSLCCDRQSKEELACIAIADNGLGIPESIRSKLFEPFFTTKPMGKGTGMGLSISYQIVVEKHRGYFTCDSQVGRGTTFRVEIPVRTSKAMPYDR
ncbi:ATP-binding protein [Roseofilum casamattae]|uniref:histidine kinase n=1 Tax=Roseofilum casamattae BLCC-M143 TaxID=3022442 RepID=A0ABT7BVK7_9CYAN|nr:ATP-binding protein [Roseofilum casamattae]MDJ1183224.1 GAF domain-containing protein [Roseofilum casamattae BLCC-M143]